MPHRLIFRKAQRAGNIPNSRIVLYLKVASGTIEHNDACIAGHATSFARGGGSARPRSLRDGRKRAASARGVRPQLSPDYPPPHPVLPQPNPPTPAPPFVY